MSSVLVTGASGGIGRAVALYLAEKGYAVALHYNTDEKAAKETAEAIRALGGRAAVFQADLTKEDEVNALFDHAEETLGFMENVVHCAGVSWRGLLTDMTLSDWNRVLDANLTAAFLTCKRALIPMIRGHRGAIVNISSMWGQVGASCEAAYSAAKAGVIGLTKALAKEEGPSGIRVNCIAPGVIDTPMNASLTEADMEALKDETPLGRIGTAKDVARSVHMLLENDFITGQVLGVNGGFVI